MSANSQADAVSPVPTDSSDANPSLWRQRIAQTINLILQGKINAVGTLTLTANAATTTLTDSRIGPKSFIGWSPTTANAAAEIKAGGFYISARGQGTATLTHANNAQTDRTFVIAIFG